MTATIGAARWRAVVDGTAPGTRQINRPDPQGSGGPAEQLVTVPYVSTHEVADIVAVARTLGLHPDPAVVAAALA
jgi:hypothetical protein